MFCCCCCYCDIGTSNGNGGGENSSSSSEVSLYKDVWSSLSERVVAKLN